MICDECTKKDRMIAGLREAIGRWRARAERTEPREAGLVRIQYEPSRRGLIRVYETDYPSSMEYTEVWKLVTDRYQNRAVMIETRGGRWLVHVWGEGPR